MLNIGYNVWEYFKDDYSEFLWIRNPFVLDYILGTFINNEEQSWVELLRDGCLKPKFIKFRNEQVLDKD